MIATFYDTETTGLPEWSAPSNHPDQPHIVQLAALFVDLDTREIVGQFDMIVKPKGWVIPPEVTAIHGISQEWALDVGFDEREVLESFLAKVDNSTRIGHNEPFDSRILRIAIARYELEQDVVDWWANAPTFCTMKMASPICKVPPTAKMMAAGRKNGHKPANLSEAYEFFTGKKLEGAHDAMVDTRACMEIYFACLDWKG